MTERLRPHMANLRPYMLFAYANYYPRGGWNDYRGSSFNKDDIFLLADTMVDSWDECGLHQQVVFPDGTVMIRHWNYFDDYTPDNASEWVEAVPGEYGYWEPTT